MSPTTEEAALQGDLQTNSQPDVETVSDAPSPGRDERPATTPEQLELVLRLQRRNGWQELTTLQQQRAADFFGAAENPPLGVVTTNIEAYCARLGWSHGMRQKTIRALKDARLLSVFRQKKPGTFVDAPATYSVCQDDTISAFQKPRKRAKRSSIQKVKPRG